MEARVLPDFLDTPRMYLRELSPADATDFYCLNANPVVLQYTGDTPFPTISAAREFLEVYQTQQKNGMGRRAMIDKATGQFLGWCGLKLNPQNGETDLGFRLFQHCWNLGLASEAALACLNFGHHVLHINTIVGNARTQNLASIRVLQKIGMVFHTSIEMNGYPGLQFQSTLNL